MPASAFVMRKKRSDYINHLYLLLRHVINSKTCGDATFPPTIIHTIQPEICIQNFIMEENVSLEPSTCFKTWQYTRTKKKGQEIKTCCHTKICHSYSNISISHLS